MNNEGKLAKKILNLLESNFSENQYDSVYEICFDIFNELQWRNFGEEVHFEVTPAEAEVQRFLYTWDILSQSNTPFEKWSHIAEKGLELVRKFLNSKYENIKQVPGYQEFRREYSDLIRKLQDDPEFMMHLTERINS